MKNLREICVYAIQLLSFLQTPLKHLFLEDLVFLVEEPSATFLAIPTKVIFSNCVQKYLLSELLEPAQNFDVD